jgi:hypothetical protein
MEFMGFVTEVRFVISFMKQGFVVETSQEKTYFRSEIKMLSNIEQSIIILNLHKHFKMLTQESQQFKVCYCYNRLILQLAITQANRIICFNLPMHREICINLMLKILFNRIIMVYNSSEYCNF